VSTAAAAAATLVEIRAALRALDRIKGGAWANALD